MPAKLLKCIDFSTFPVGPGPNPRAISGIRFSVFDFNNVLLPTSQIKASGAFVGLDTGFRLEIEFPRKGVKAICMSLTHTARPPRIAFISAAGNTVGTATLAATQNVAQEVECTSPSIKRVIVKAPSDEALLLTLCYG